MLFSKGVLASHMYIWPSFHLKSVRPGVRTPLATASNGSVHLFWKHRRARLDMRDTARGSVVCSLPSRVNECASDSQVVSLAKQAPCVPFADIGEWVPHSHCVLEG